MPVQSLAAIIIPCYGLWSIVCISLRTDLVEQKMDRVLGSMGYLGYGL